MTSFQDKFDRADVNLNGDNGWVVMASDNDGDDKIQIQDRAAENEDILQVYAWQATTVPTTNEQEVSAWACCSEAGATTYNEIFLNGAFNATFTQRAVGISLRLYCLPNSERKIEIIQQENLASGGAFASVVAGSLTLVNAGGEVQSGYHGHLVNDGALGTLQHIRLIITEDEFGLLARAYVNSEDDDRPTLSVRLRVDLIAATGTAGHWGFGFGATSTSNVMFVAEFSAGDYAPGIAVDSVLKTNHPTLLELRDAVKTKYAKGGNTDLDDKYVDDIIAEEVESLVLSCGDLPWFLIRKGNVALTIDVNGFCTMPAYMEHVHKVERLDRKTPSPFTFEAMESDGDLVLRFNTARDASGEVYIVTYIQRFLRMDSPDDFCVIPRKYMGLVVYKACEMIAGTGDRLPALEASFARAAAAKHREFRMEMVRHFRKTRTRFRPRRRATATPFTHQYRRW